MAVAAIFILLPSSSVASPALSPTHTQPCCSMTLPCSGAAKTLLKYPWTYSIIIGAVLNMVNIHLLDDSKPFRPSAEKHRMLLGNRMTAQHRAKGWADHAKKLLPRQLTETVLERQGKNGMK